MPLPAKSASASLVPGNLSQKQQPIAVKGENQAKLVQCMLQDKKGPQKATDTVNGEVERNQAFIIHVEFTLEERAETREGQRTRAIRANLVETCTTIVA